MSQGTKAILFGGLAALGGALLWASLFSGARVEIGWLAWIIGAVVGFAVVIGGGRSANAAIIAVVMTFASICGGKILGVSWSMGSSVEEHFAGALSQDSFNVEMKDARDFANVRSDADMKRYMMSNEFTEASAPEQITDEEFAYFKSETAVHLRAQQQNPPAYEQWRQARLASISSAVAANFSFWERLKSTLGLLDIVFFILGMATAFKIVAKDDGV